MTKKILLVDDNRLVLKFLTKLLEGEGHEVFTAHDGVSALDKLSTVVPDIIFLDLFMPNIDGFKLCKIVRSRPRLKNCYIVVLSAAVAEQRMEHSDIGANACIAKGSFASMAKNVLAVIAASGKAPEDASGKPILGLESVYARQLTKELLARNRHLEDILNGMAEGIIEVLDERIVYANDAAVTFFDTPPENLLYAELPTFFDKRAARMVSALLHASNRRPWELGEENPLLLNGRQVVMRKLPIKTQSATAVVLIRDISERKRLESQLLTAQKMESIGTLAGGIAHDFNNLLMGIQGNTSLMLLDIDPENPLFESIKSIERCVDSGSKLTRQLLGFVSTRKLSAKPTDLSELAEKTARMFARTRKEITVETDFEKESWTVEIDPGQIEQVMVNLYVNASQAMPAGGRIRVQTRNTELSARQARPYNLKAGRYLKVSVNDTGIGIDKQSRQRIFEPFFTTKPFGKSAGLGLASAFSIIKNHGGGISFHSRKGKGSTFYFFLPASRKKAAVEPERPPELLRGTETVLLIDDERFILDTLKRLLLELGYQALEAQGGREGLQRFEQQYREIDLVILDVVMPDMSGGEVFDRIKAIKPDARVLLLSGYGSNGLAGPIMERGCDGFLQKPVDLRRFSQALRQVLDRAANQT